MSTPLLFALNATFYATCLGSFICQIGQLVIDNWQTGLRLLSKLHRLLKNPHLKMKLTDSD